MKIDKKIATGVVASLIVLGASAQKAKVVSAYNYNKSYERDKDCKELTKGIAAIEPATKDVKTGNWAKTWYYGGNLYFNAALTQDSVCSAKFPGALNKAHEYYLNALKYNIEEEGAKDLDFDKEADQMKFMGYLMNRNTKFGDLAYVRDIMGNKFPYLSAAFVEKGYNEFSAGNYQEAKDYYLKSISTKGMLGQMDTAGIYNAAIASEKLGQDEEAIELYSVLTQVKYGGPSIFMYIARIHEENNDTTKKIEVIRDGLKAYPNDPDLVREELSYLLVTGQTDQALENFDKAIANEPDNASLYYNRGLINDQLGNVDKAAADYSKALETDPKFFDAAYNLGAMYYNLGVEWNNKASGYGLNETAKYKEATGKANDFFAKARPALETAHEIDPTDKNTMASLTKIYAIEGADDKYSAMKAKLQGK